MVFPTFLRSVFFLVIFMVLAFLVHYGMLEARGTEKTLPVFSDFSQQAGITSKVICGDELTEYLIDVNGTGAAFFDYDNDGDQDIYLVNGSSRKSASASTPPHDFLLQNNGDGTFIDVTKSARLGDTSWSSGCAVGDYNNDGYPDLYVTNYGPNKLYRNEGDGTFSEVGGLSGVAGPELTPPKWSMGASFGDYDNDGHLDLYVCNFVQFDYWKEFPPPKAGSPCKLKGIPIACPPDMYRGEQDLLYRNKGDGTFTDVTRAAGFIREDPGRAFASAFSDFDNDGDLDLYVANDAGPNFYYINNGDGTYTDGSLTSGASFDEFGNDQGSMGLTVGDFNNDGLIDIFVTNFIDQYNTLYRNQGSHLFLDRSTQVGLGVIGFGYSGWGTKFFDFDNDGWLDLFIANGHTMEQLEEHFPTDTFAEADYLLRNIDGKQLIDISDTTGIRKLPNRVGRGTAFGDYDNDGDVDILVINKNDAPFLLRNDGGNENKWLVLRTEGVASNRSGIGARIEIAGGGIRRLREVRRSDSYLSSNDIRVHVGLADLTEADIRIRWPSGQVNHFPNVAANRFYLVKEDGSMQPDPRIYLDIHEEKISK